MFFTIQNEDMLAHRVVLKPINDKRIRVEMKAPGPIATGVTKRVKVTLDATDG